MILIQSHADDAHAQAVHERLRERGASVTWFDPGDFPERASVELRWDGRSTATLRTGDAEIDLDSVSVIWHRRPTLTEPSAQIRDDQLREYAARECRVFLSDVWSSLECTWLPGPMAAMTLAAHKFTQLRFAARLGFEIPPTVITNDPDAVLEFRSAHGPRLISKLPGPALFSLPGGGLNRYTQPVTRRDLGYIDAVRHAPVIVQPYIDKSTEIRATVVGGAVFAAEIHSQNSPRARDDWRRYDLLQTPHRIHELPASIRERCLCLVSSLGLAYGAIDLIHTPDGRYVFLELNPNGQYLWIEELTGLEITDAIVELLCARDREHAGGRVH